MESYHHHLRHKYGRCQLGWCISSPECLESDPAPVQSHPSLPENKVRNDMKNQHKHHSHTSPLSFSEFSLLLLESVPPPRRCWISSEYSTVQNLQMWHTFAPFFTSLRLRYIMSFEGSSSRIFSTIFLYSPNLSMSTASFLL